MVTTKSKSPSKKGKDATANVSPQDAKLETVATTKRNTNTMSDNNTPSSILEFSEDIGNAEAPTPLPIGEYPAEIRAATKKTSAAGNEYGSVQFFIAPEAYPADFTEGDADGALLTYNRVAVQDTPAARHRLRKFCEAIGAPTGKSLDMNDWIGRTATVSIQHDTYEGETHAAIGKVVAA